MRRSRSRVTASPRPISSRVYARASQPEAHAQHLFFFGNQYIYRHAYGSGLLAEGSRDSLHDPTDRISGELLSTPIIELVRRPHSALTCWISCSPRLILLNVERNSAWRPRTWSSDPDDIDAVGGPPRGARKIAPCACSQPLNPGTTASDRVTRTAQRRHDRPE